MRRLLALTTATLVAATVVSAPAQGAARDIRLHRWSSDAQLLQGERVGTKVANGAVTLTSTPHSLVYDDPWGAKKRWSYGAWTSPWQRTGFDAKRLIPSWNAVTPSGTWLQVLVRVRKGSKVGSWDVVGRWTLDTGTIHRASTTSQPDDLSRVDVDTVAATSSFDSYQVRVRLLRKPGSTATPKLTSVSAVASTFGSKTAATSRTTMTSTKILGVPRYSQMIHKGHYPQWGGGGEAWCSPTSTTMVLDYFKTGPDRSKYTWAKGSTPQVDHAARYTYDHKYKGTGNWPFNTAYASQYGNDAFVTRLSSLRDAEAFIKAGIPVVASIAFGRGELSGAPISSTPGHLLVIVGFTRTGQVVVNDPAGSSSSNVRRTYSRSQLERAWLKGSGGVVYIVRPPGKKLPAGSYRWS